MSVFGLFSRPSIGIVVALTGGAIA